MPETRFHPVQAACCHSVGKVIFYVLVAALNRKKDLHTTISACKMCLNYEKLSNLMRFLNTFQQMDTATSYVSHSIKFSKYSAVRRGENGVKEIVREEEIKDKKRMEELLENVFGIKISLDDMDYRVGQS